MENITLGQVKDVLVFIATLSASIGALYALLMKGFKKQLEPLQKDINDKIDTINDNMELNEFNRLKSNLVTYLCLAETNVITEEQKRLAHEEFDKYINPPFNGNSYIKEKFEQLRKEGNI